MDQPLTEFSDLPDDIIRELCDKMTIEQLTAFVQTAARQYNLCGPILQEKIDIEENKRKLAIQAIILAKLASIGPGKVVDASNMNNNGMGLRTIPLPRTSMSGKVVVQGYNIVTTQARYNEIADIMNTRPL